jgi:hypothetical protein
MGMELQKDPGQSKQSLAKKIKLKTLQYLVSKHTAKL